MLQVSALAEAYPEIKELDLNPVFAYPNGCFAVDARVVLITDTLNPRLSAPIAVRLNAGQGTPGLFATHGPTIVLLEALVLAMAAADPERSETALAALNELRRSIAGRPLDVDPD